MSAHQTPRPIHTAPPRKKVLLALWEPWPIGAYRFIVGRAKDSARAMGWLPLKSR
jgi:hypothetical protein